LLSVLALQRTKHHAAAAPALSSSSQNSSFTALQHAHSGAAAERDMEEVSSRLSQRSTGNAALQPSRSNAASEQEAALLHSHAQPMQVQSAVQ